MTTSKVQSEFIATNAISGTIIADNAITATHIATNAISGVLVQDGGIVSTMIAANNVTAAKIVTNGVLTRHVLDDNITAAKLANSINTDIATGVTGNTTANAALPKAGGTMTGDLLVKPSASGATATSGTVGTFESNDNTEVSILGGSSSVLGLNFGHSGDNDEGKITFNTTAGSEDLQIVSSKEITLDAAGDIILDAGGEQVNFSHAGTVIGQVDMGSNNYTLRSKVDNKDIEFHGTSSGNVVALKLDMSEAGAATFSAPTTTIGSAAASTNVELKYLK